jgi:hypothetical protein
LLLSMPKEVLLITVFLSSKFHKINYVMTKKKGHNPDLHVDLAKRSRRNVKETVGNFVICQVIKSLMIKWVLHDKAKNS